MKRQHIIMLVIILLVLIGLYLILIAQRGTGTIKKPKDLGVSADSSQVNKIELQMPTDTVIIEKQAGKWRITEPVDARADQNVVKRIIDALAAAELDVQISENPDRHAEYNVAKEDGRYLKVTEKDGDIIEYWVGKLGPGGMTYIRFDGDRKVWLLSSPLGTAIRANSNDYRDKTIFDLSPEEVTAVIVDTPERDFSLALQDSVWMFSPELDGQPAEPDSNKVMTYLQTLKNLRTQEFLDDPDSIAKISFDEPDLTAKIMKKSGESIDIKAVYADEAERKYAVKIGDKVKPIYIMSIGILNNLARKEDYMMNPAPPPPPPGQQMNMGGQGGQQITPEMQRKIQEAMRKQQMQGN